MDIIELTRTIRRRIGLIAGITLFSAALSVVVALVIPRSYESTTTLLIQQESGMTGAMGAMLGISALPQWGVSTDYLKTIAMSDTIVMRTMDTLGLRNNKFFSLPDAGEEDYLRVFRKNLLVVTEPTLVRITFFSPDPELAAAVANEIAKQVSSFTKSSALEEYENYQKIFDIYQKQLKEIETKIKEYEEKHHVVQIDAQMSAEIDSYAQYQAELLGKQMEFDSLSTVLENTTDLEVWTRTRQRIEALKSEIQLTKSKVGEIERSMEAAPGVKNEYMELLRDQKTISMKLAAVDTQRDISMFETERSDQKFRVLDRAFPAKTPSRPKRKLVVLICMATGFFLSFFL
jgi:tyrosine-protein kinase Etk/Wzc